MYRFRFTRNSSFVQEIMAFLKLGPLEALEIGDGILAVKVDGNFDIFFDTGRWKLEIVVKKEFEAKIFPEIIPYTGVLPGKHYKGGVNNKEKALLIARKQLSPRGSHYKLVTDPEEKKASETDNPFKDIFGSDDIFGNIFGKK